MADFSTLIASLSTPKSQPRVGTVNHEVFLEWTGSIQHLMPEIIGDHVELYLQAWVAYHRKRLQDAPGGDRVPVNLSNRGIRLLMLLDALRRTVHSRMTVDEIIVLQEDEDDRLRRLWAEICVTAGIFKTEKEALDSFEQDIFPPEALLLIS
jgi:hypothetical protein